MLLITSFYLVAGCFVDALALILFPSIALFLPDLVHP